MSRKLVIIDDSAPMHALIRARLIGEELEIHSASDGRSGLEMVRALQPDLVLLDVDMPDLNGFDVCRQLKSDTVTLHIPVVFLTGASTGEDKIRGLELGAVDYITKPFDPAELRARVRSALRLKYLMDLLARKAQIDGLTGLWNRRHFDEVIQEQMSLSARHRLPLSCVLLDVDHFKAINDRFGHPFGDEVLKAIAGAINDTVRLEDTVCRYGGEEFAIILPNTALVGAILLAERVRSSIASRQVLHKTGSVNVSASFGVAEYQPGLPVAFIEAADRALYQAKKDGRNRVVSYTPPVAA